VGILTITAKNKESIQFNLGFMQMLQS